MDWIRDSQNRREKWEKMRQEKKEEIIWESKREMKK